MEQPSPQISSLGFFALIAILFNLSFFHQGICSVVDKGLTREIAVVEPVSPADGEIQFQAKKDPPFGCMGKITSTAGRHQSPSQTTGPPFFRRASLIVLLVSRCPDCPIKRIISILQKKNCWHQSSEDEPHLRICS